MATVSSAGGGSSMGNAQVGTRGLSAGDWIRLQRLRGARANGYSNGSTNGVLTAGSPIFNKDVVPPQSNQFDVHNNSAIMTFPVVGTSKIRRTSSNWIDYVASQNADYVLRSQAALNGISVKRTLTKLCSCTSSTLNTKTGICTRCNQTTHVRIM